MFGRVSMLKHVTMHWNESIFTIKCEQNSKQRLIRQVEVRHMGLPSCIDHFGNIFIENIFIWKSHCFSDRMQNFHSALVAHVELLIETVNIDTVKVCHIQKLNALINSMHMRQLFKTK